MQPFRTSLRTRLSLLLLPRLLPRPLRVVSRLRQRLRVKARVGLPPSLRKHPRSVAHWVVPGTPSSVSLAEPSREPSATASVVTHLLRSRIPDKVEEVTRRAKLRLSVDAGPLALVSAPSVRRYLNVLVAPFLLVLVSRTTPKTKRLLADVVSLLPPLRAVGVVAEMKRVVRKPVRRARVAVNLLPRSVSVLAEAARARTLRTSVAPPVSPPLGILARPA